MKQFVNGSVSSDDQLCELIAKLLPLPKRDSSQGFKQCAVCYKQCVDSCRRQVVSVSDFVRVQRETFEWHQLKLLQTRRAAVGTLLPQVFCRAGERRLIFDVNSVPRFVREFVLIFFALRS